MIRWLFHPCLLGHVSDPVIVMHGTVMHFACRRCQADLGEVLPGQAFRVKPIKPLRAKKLKLRKSADVLRIARKA